MLRPTYYVLRTLSDAAGSGTQNPSPGVLDEDEMSQSPWTNHPNNGVRPESGEASAELS